MGSRQGVCSDAFEYLDFSVCAGCGRLYDDSMDWWVVYVDSVPNNVCDDCLTEIKRLKQGKVINARRRVKVDRLYWAYLLGEMFAVRKDGSNPYGLPYCGGDPK